MHNEQPKDKQKHFIKENLQIASSCVGIKFGITLFKQPFFVVQTSKQANPSIPLIEMVKKIYSDNGLKGFYKSMPATLCINVLTESYRGPLMVSAPKYINEYTPDSLSKYSVFLTGFLAAPTISFVDTMLLGPLVRMSTHQLSVKENIKIKDIALSYAKGHFIKECYQGSSALFLQNTVLWWTFFWFDDFNKNCIKKHVGEVSYFTLAATSVAGGIVMSSVNIAFDTIRVQMQQVHNKDTSILNVTKSLIRNHGFKALFAGLPPKMIGGVIGYGYKSFLREYWDKDKDAAKVKTENILLQTTINQAEENDNNNLAQVAASSENIATSDPLTLSGNNPPSPME
ncbi:MAG: carrier protein [Rickettsiaceae bacterium]|jgi:hypothetical protein|nr:carrier protein [Rickettsiaceae bacterium]